MPSDLIRGWAPVRGKDASRAKYGQFRHDRGCPALTTQASQGRVIGIRIRPANELSRRDEYHSQNDRLDPGRRCRLRNARSADISASFRSRSGRRTRPRLCPGRIGVRSGLWPQPLGDGGDSVALIGLLEILQLWMPGRHARLGDFVVDAMAACAGLALAAGLDWAIRRASTQRGNVLTQKSRGHEAREDRSQYALA